MKGLKLINSFVKGIINHEKKTSGPVPVIRKTATSNFCSSDFWHIFILLLVILLGGHSEKLWGGVDSGDKPYYVAGNEKTWYSLYYWDNEVSTGSLSGAEMLTHSVFAPSQNTVYYFAKNDAFFGAGQAYLDIRSSTDGTNYTNFVSNRYFNNSTYSEYNNTGVPQLATSIRFYRTSKSPSTMTFRLKNFRIKLAEHIRLFNENSTSGIGTTAYSKDFGTKQVGSVESIEINIRSFLTSASDNKLHITMSSGDADVFRLDNTSGKTTKDITVGTNMCGVWGGVTSGQNTNSSTYKIKIWFYPKESKKETAVYTISNGTQSATITLSGTGIEYDFGSVLVNQHSTTVVTHPVPTGSSNVTINAPDHFKVSADQSNWGTQLTNHSGNFYIRFEPNAATADSEPKDDNVEMIWGSNHYYIHVSGTALRNDAFITWDVADPDLILMPGQEFALTATWAGGEPVTHYISSNSSAIAVMQTTDGKYYIKAVGQGGDGARITASENATGVYKKPTDVYHDFTISSKHVQYINWDQAFTTKIPSGGTSASVTFTAIACDKGSTTSNNHPVSYSYSTDGTNYTPISGSTQSFTKGTYYIKATTPTATYSGQEYLGAEMVRTMVMRVQGESCGQYSLVINEIRSGNDVPYTLAGLPSDMEGHVHYGTSTHVHVKINTSDFWEWDRGWTWGDHGEHDFSVPESKTQSQSQLTFRSVYQDFNEDLMFYNVKVIQQTYFNKGGDATKTLSFGDITAGSQSAEQSFTIQFSNIPDIEVVQSGDYSQFTLVREVSTKANVSATSTDYLGCDCFGSATYKVRFKPTTAGEKTATFVFKTNINGKEESFTLTTTGNATGKPQSLAWDNNHALFGTLTSLSGTIDITNAAKSYDGTEETHLPITYSLDQVSPAGAVTLSDDQNSLIIHHQGTFILKANQPGGGVYEKAQELPTATLTVYRVNPSLEITGNTTPGVLQKFTVTTKTNSTGVIQYTVPSKCGSDSTAVISDYDKTSSRSCSATVLTRCTETGVPTTIVAHLAQTDIYYAATATLPVNANKITPTIVWPSNSSEIAAVHTVGVPVQLQAYIKESSSLKVEYTSSNTNIATIDNATGIMTCIAAGIVKITAKQTTGNCDFTSTTQTISYLFVISPADFGTVNITATKQVPFTISTGKSGTFAFAASDDGEFFFSKGTTYGWEDKSLAGVNDGETIYIKFQPHAAGSNAKTFTVTHNSVTYNGNLTGTGNKYTVSLKTNITQGNHYGWKTGTPLPDDFFRSSTDQYSVSLTGDPEFLIQRQSGDGGSFERQKTNIARGTQYRVGHFPENTSQKQVTVTVTDNYFNISYSYILQGTGVLLEHGFGSVEVGKGSTPHQIEMSYFDISNNLTVTVPNDNFLLSETGTSDWKTSLNLTSTRASFFVHYAPEVSNVAQHIGNIEIKDNNTNIIYKYHVTGTPTKSEILFPDCEIGASQTPLPFTMSNFICEGGVDVTPPADFVVSSSETGQFQSGTLTIGAKGTFYVKLATTATIKNYTGDVTMVDKKTGHTYKVSLKSNVTKKASSISISKDRVYFFSDDYSTHTMVGTVYNVHGSPKEIEPSIVLTPANLNYIEVVQPNSLRIKEGVTVTSNTDITVTASFAEDQTHAAATSKDFTVRISPVNATGDRIWKYNSTTSKWYVYNDELDLGSWSIWVKDYSVNLYLPNVTCTGNYFAIRNASLTEADYPFSTTLYCSDVPQSIKALTCTKSNKYEDTKTTFNLPAKGAEAQLYTLTNEYVNSEHANIRDKEAKIEIEVPQHYHQLQTSKTVDFKNVQVGEVAYADVLLNGMDENDGGLFKSFLTTNELTIAGSNCPTVFFLNPDNGGQSLSLVPANKVLSPYNEIEGATNFVMGSGKKYYIRIYFKPLTAGTFTGTFNLTDGSMTLPITVNGTSVATANEPQYIVWDQDLSHFVGSGSTTLTGKSTSGMTVTYSGGGSGISTSGSTLSYSGEGTATITANCVQGSNNGIYYDDASPIDRDVTAYSAAPTPGSCSDPTSISNPSAWNKSGITSPYTMAATAGFTWNEASIANSMTFNLSFTNCSAATVKIYAKGTNDPGNVVGTFNVNNTGTQTINFASGLITQGTTFYCSFDGTAVSTGDETNATLGFSITNIKMYSSPAFTQLQTGAVNFGTQRVAQAGITKNIKAISYNNISGKIVASITGDDKDCFTLITDINPSVIDANCEDGIAYYDVRFIPTKAKSNLSATLHILGPSGQTADISLTGTSVKRDICIDWQYDKKTVDINALGSGNTKSLTTDENAYLYDAFRGKDAKLTTVPNYTVKNGDNVQMLPNTTGNIIKINTDQDGYITSIEATGLGSGKAYVIADASVITSSHPLFNTLATTCTLTVNVNKVAPTLDYTPKPFPTLTYPQDLDNGKDFTVTTNSDNVNVTWTYSVSPSDRLTISQNSNAFNVKPQASAGDATITVNSSATALYTAASINVPVTVAWGELIISVDASKLSLTSATHDLALDNVPGLVTANYPSGVSYTYSIKSGTGTTVKTATMDASNKELTIKDIGKIELEVHGSHTGGKTDVKSTGAVNVGIGTLIFDNNDGKGDGKWMTGENWAPHRDMVPDQTNFDAQISATCVIDKAASGSSDATNGIAKCHDLTIDAGQLNVSADCVLDVANKITNNSGASKFVLEASTDHSATVVFHDGTPDATIKMYFRGHTHEEFGGGYKNPEWQYRGYIGNYTDGLSSNVSVYKWDEQEDGENVSRWKVASDHLPWAGYCMANMTDQPTDYSYTTKLIPIPQSGSVSPYTITYTTKQGNDTLAGAGVNILTNSYSAPIKVSELTFTNMNSVVYFFKNDYYLSWKKGKATAYVSCPSETCADVCGDDRIPAGQGFLVQADETLASSLSIPSTAIVTNEPSGPYYAPAQRRFNILSITVSGNDIEDEVFLLEGEECSKSYDNGYDGTKMFADGLPQIYAKNKFGNTSINADSSMLGQFIGFRGIPELTEYEMKFNTDRLEGFTELYLFDHLTRRYADILAGGTYHFSATEGDDPQRFQIMGRRDDGTYFTGEEQWIEVVGRQALLHGFDNDNEPIYITDLMGKRAWSDNSKNGPWFNLPDLPAGVYIIHCGKATAKFVSK